MIFFDKNLPNDKIRSSSDQKSSQIKTASSSREHTIKAPKNKAPSASWDVQILEAIQRGGREREKAITQLFQDTILRKSVGGYIHKRGGQDYEIEEIFSHAIVEFDEKIRLGKVQIQSGIRAYLFGICRMMWRNCQRKSGTRQEFKEQFTTFSQQSKEQFASLQEEMEKKEKAEQLKQLLDRLSPTLRKVLRLWMLGYSMEEIAQKCGLANANTAKVYKCKAMKKLRGLIGSHPGLKL